MKRKLYSVIAAALTMLLFVACKGDNSGNNILPNILPKHWLQLENGKLTQFPMPFTDFTKGEDAIVAWEKQYSSAPAPTNDANILIFIPATDTKLNPMRSYTLLNDKLNEASYFLAKELVFDNKNDNVSPEFEALIKKAGFEKYNPQTAKLDFLTMYTGKGLMVKVINNALNKTNKKSFAPEEINIANYATILITKYEGENNPNNPDDGGEEPVNPNDNSVRYDVKDFPLLLSTKAIKDYTREEIDAHEAKFDRTYSDKLSKVGEKFEYISLPSNPKTNFQQVTYNRVDKKGSNGKVIPANISCLSLTIKTVEQIRDPKLTEYIAAQGFVFEDEINAGGITARAYVNDQNGFRLFLSSVDNNATLWLFSQVKQPGGDPGTGGETPKKREAFYLPLFMWNEPITPDSPIIKAEEKRGFTATFKEKDPETETFPRPNRIDANPPYDEEYGARNMKAGILGFTYEKARKSEPDVCGRISMFFNAAYDKQKRDCKDPELKKFLEDNGFEYKRDYTLYGADCVDYYNADKKVYLMLMTMRGLTSGEFVQLDSWDNTQAAALRNQLIKR